MADPCKHELTLGGIKKTVGQLETTVFGPDGLNSQVIILTKDMTDVKDDIGKLATSYSALAKSEIQKDANEKAKLDLEEKKIEWRKKRSSVIQRLGTVFGIVFGAVATLYIILDHIANH